MPNWFIVGLVTIVMFAGAALAVAMLAPGMQRRTRIGLVIVISVLEFLLIVGLALALVLVGMD